MRVVEVAAQGGRVPAPEGVLVALVTAIGHAAVSPARISTSSAFWTCSRFSDWSKMRLRGPSITSDVISSPRCAGRQCIATTSRAGRIEQGVVDLVAGEGVAALLGLGLLAHRRPGVGVDDRGARGRPRRGSCPKTSRPPDAAASSRRALDDPLVRGVARRMREPDLHPERRAEQGQRVVDVVAVADEREHAPRERRPKRSSIVKTSASAWHGCSRRVRPLMTGIAGLRRELDDDLVRTGPDHDRVDEPLEVAGDVADALAGAEDDVVGQVDRVPAELGHAGLERDARPQARLLEEHRERPAGQRRIARADGSPGTRP